MYWSRVEKFCVNMLRALQQSIVEWMKGIGVVYKY